MEPGDVLPVHSDDSAGMTVALYYDVRRGLRIITAGEFLKLRMANQPEPLVVVPPPAELVASAPTPRRKPRAKKAAPAE